jgi:hypothetical protein
MNTSITNGLYSGTSLSSNTMVLQETIGAYTDEAYTNAKKLSGTGIVSGNPTIDTNTETYVGQLRWNKNIDLTKINVASISDSTAGETADYSTDFLNYIKTVRTFGAKKVNMAQVVTQVDGLAKMGRDFGEVRATDEHNAILAILKGVALSEVCYGALSASGSTGLGGQTYDNDPTNKRYGFYVDLGNTNDLIADASAAVQGAARAENFLTAFGMGYKDYEPEYAYLVVNPSVMGSLRSANLVDTDKVSDGNVEFNTIFGGKFRLIQTRASLGISSADLTKLNTGAGVDVTGLNTSYIVLPGALAMEALTVPDSVEITREGSSFKGGGTTTVWNRWGYVLAPAGYSWDGPQDAFPTDANYMAVYGATTDVAPNAWITPTAAFNARIGKGSWARKAASALSLGILPVFHK